MHNNRQDCCNFRAEASETFSGSLCSQLAKTGWLHDTLVGSKLQRAHLRLAVRSNVKPCPCAQFGACLQGSWKSPRGLKGPETRSHSGLRSDCGTGLGNSPRNHWSLQRPQMCKRQGNKQSPLVQTTSGDLVSHLSKGKGCKLESGDSPTSADQCQHARHLTRANTSNAEVRGYGRWLALPDRGPKISRQKGSTWLIH